ncbi:Nudix hydrolase 16, mitochondrial [Sarracenia purpurea var. burkii]
MTRTEPANHDNNEQSPTQQTRGDPNIQSGGWENDETVEEAAVREAIEEAGVRGDLMGFLGDYDFRSKTHQDEFSPEGLCRASMFALLVKEELESWPEQSTRSRTWITIPEAAENCRHAWMREALLQGFSKWLDDKILNTGEDNFRNKINFLSA